MNTVKKTLERWHCTDSRFPIKTSRPVGNKSLDTLRGEVLEDGTILDGFQLHPVLVILEKKGKKENYTFVFGNGRLQRIRDFFEEGCHTGYVDVLVVEGMDPNDKDALALIENNQRSPNELGDYHTLCDLRKQNPNISYIEVFNMTGMSIQTQKKLDKTYKNVPLWAQNAMLRGEIAVTTAKAIGGLGTDSQGELKVLLKEQGYLSNSDVTEKKRFIQQEAYAPMLQSSSLFPVQPKQFYDRADLEAIHQRMLEQNWEAALIGIESLLSQTE